ncbi:MAG: thioredoxin [Phreatobacter sp.]|nr:thioredoxin [Phreatobacter sp.]
MAATGAASASAGRAAPPPAPPPPPADDDADWGAAFAEEAQAKPTAAADEAKAKAKSDDMDFDAPVPAAEAPSIQPSADVPPLPSRLPPADDGPSPRPARPKADEPPKRRFRKPSLPRPSGRSFRMSPSVVILLLGSALLATFLLGREQVVRTVPDSASVYERIGLPVNLRGVEFRDVKGANEIVDGVVVLVVEGQLVNITSRGADLPRLRLAVRDAGGKEIYTWTATPPAARLEAGQAVPFRSRLASPPPDGSSVEVRFFTRMDAGGR